MRRKEHVEGRMPMYFYRTTTNQIMLPEDSIRKPKPKAGKYIVSITSNARREYSA